MLMATPKEVWRMPNESINSLEEVTRAAFNSVFRALEARELELRHFLSPSFLDARFAAVVAGGESRAAMPATASLQS